MGVQQQFWVDCDWCGTGPDVKFGTYDEAYDELLRLSRYESWLLLDRGATEKVALCPDCAAEGRA